MTTWLFTELWQPKLNWRGNLARLLLYFQAFNGAIAVFAAMAGVSAWLKLFGISTQYSLLAGCVFVPCGVIGGILWKRYGIMREQSESGMVEHINRPQVLQWLLDIEMARKHGVDVTSLFKQEQLPAEVSEALHSHKKEELNDKSGSL